MIFSKPDIYAAIDTLKELSFEKETSYHVNKISRAQPDLSFFMNGGMKGHLRVGQKNDLNYFGNLTFVLFEAHYGDVPIVPRELLTDLFQIALNEGVEALDINEPVLMGFLYDAFYASQWLPSHRSPIAFAAVASIVKGFQEILN